MISRRLMQKKKSQIFADFICIDLQFFTVNLWENVFTHVSVSTHIQR